VSLPRLVVHEHRLDNGLKILLVPSRDAPLVAVSLWYRTGSRHDPPGEAGTAHMLEHMLYKGTRRHPQGAYDHILHEQGAVHNASTWYERTNYYILISSDRYETALELEADRMRGALLDAAGLGDEIEVVVNELQRSEDDPATALHERLLARAFPGHPYGRPVGGTPGEVRGLTAERLRDFYDAHYRPNHAYLVVAGDYDEGRILERVASAFGPIPAGPARLSEPPGAPPQSAERRFELRRAGGREQLLLGYRAPARRHPDVPALDLLAQVMGQGRMSRLHRALVEPGMAVQAGAENPAALVHPFLFYIDVSPSLGAPRESIDAVLEREIDRLSREPVTDAELGRARKQARVDLVLRCDRVSARGALVGELEATVGWRYLDDYLSRLAAVEAEDVRRVAATYLVPRGRTVGHFRPDGEGEKSA